MRVYICDDITKQGGHYRRCLLAFENFQQKILYFSSSGRKIAAIFSRHARSLVAIYSVMIYPLPWPLQFFPHSWNEIEKYFLARSKLSVWRRYSWIKSGKKSGWNKVQVVINATVGNDVWTSKTGKLRW